MHVIFSFWDRRYEDNVNVIPKRVQIPVQMMGRVIPQGAE